MTNFSRPHARPTRRIRTQPGEQPNGYGLKPDCHYLLNIALALVLSTVIGLEREFHQKSAGLRTHALVGLGAAPFMVVSTYGCR